MFKQKVFIKIMKKIIFIALIIFFAIIAALVFDIGRRDNTEPVNFRECALLGYPILESYPRQCRIPNGKSFTEEVEQTPDNKNDLIKLDTPLPNETVKSPIIL